MTRQIQIFCFALLLSTTLSAQQITVENIVRLNSDVNSKSEETLPLLNSDGTILYFVRAFHDENIGGVNAGQDIWYSLRDSTSQWTSPINLTELNSPLNNAVVGIGAKDSILYLLNTYSNPLRWRFGIATTYQNNDGLWNKPSEFPLNMENPGPLRGYFVNPGKDIILVSTENSDSYGNEDLFLYKKDSGTWSTRIHLNELINTTGSEISPFLSPDNKILFFASDGHGGFGGFDIFFSERMDDSWEKWSIPVNIGSEINSSDFEGFLSTYENGETFFVSSKEGQSSDIYSAYLRVKFLTNELLSLNAELTEKFKEVLLMDTTMQFSISHVSDVTSELSQNFNKVLDGNKSMNRGLFGINERDSIVNGNVIDLEATHSSSYDHPKIRLQNSALSQDIKSIVVFNEKVTEYITMVSPKVANRIEDQSEFQPVLDLKRSIGEQISNNAELKQELSELISKNAFLKTAYSQLPDDKIETAFRINTNNDLIEAKLNKWSQNLIVLKEDYTKLIEATAKLHVYLTNNLDKELENSSLHQEFITAISMDTSVNHRISLLSDKLPQLTQNLEQLLEGNESLDVRLYGVSSKDSVLNKNILELNGLNRESSDYKKLAQRNQQLNLGIKELVDQNSSLEFVLIDSVNDSFSSDIVALENKIPSQINRNANLKQEISLLILNNALLKTSLSESKDGGESALAGITNNNALIREKFEEWKINLQELQKNTTSLEIASNYISLSTSTQHVLFQDSLLNLQLAESLRLDNSLSQYAIDLYPSDQMQKLAQHSLSINQDLSGSNALQYRINHNLISLDTLAASSPEYKKLLAENDSLMRQMDQFIPSSEQKTMPYQGETTLGQNTTEAQKISTLTSESYDLMSVNSMLKKEISVLIIENTGLKQSIIKSPTDANLITMLNLKNQQLNSNIEQWSVNLQQLQEKNQQLQELYQTNKNSVEVLDRCNELNMEFSQALLVDTTVNAQIINLTSEILELKPLIDNMAMLNGQLNNQMTSINQDDEYINQSVIQQVMGESTTDEKEYHLRMKSIDQSISTMETSILPSMAQYLEDSANFQITPEEELLIMKRELSVRLSKNALLKQSVVKAIQNNEVLKEQLLGAAPMKTANILAQIMENNKFIHNTIVQWSENLETLKGSAINYRATSTDIELVATSNTDENTKIEGYAVQLLAMPKGVDPRESFFKIIGQNEIKKAIGKDGLDRYYTGKYDSLEEALKIMRKIRKKGYSDAFVRAIVKYSIL